MTRAAVALGAAAALLVWAPALAQEGQPVALVFLIEGTTLPQLVARPPVTGVADLGGIAMLRGPDPSIEAVRALAAVGVPVVRLPASGSPQAIDRRIQGFDEELLVVVVGLAPTGGIAAEGPDAVLLARGAPENLLALDSDIPLSTLTSDSTRRHGIVTPADIVVTVRQVTGLEEPRVEGGSPISIVATEPPVGLYRTYLEYRELSAPVQAAVGVWELVLGVFAVWALVARRVSSSLPRFALAATLSLPVLFLALLLVGHLPSLTYATVVPVLVGVTALAGLVLVRVADRSGVGVALAWAGGIGLAGLVTESLLGWTAAFAPMLGGSQLDGFRFFGLPNAFLGLGLGGAVLLATRIPSTTGGAWLIAVVGLWAGAPWFGADIGGAVTLFAAAGLWWGIRGERAWLPTAVVTVGCVLVGVALVIFAHRELTDAPTHITRFTTSTGGLSGIVDKAIDRLEIGVRLLREQPPALIPVVGTLLALFFVLLRPPAVLREGFAREAWARPATITILLGRIVAYLANDTGAAALGLGFGIAMVCLFAVSLAGTREMMDA